MLTARFVIAQVLGIVVAVACFGDFSDARRYHSGTVDRGPSGIFANLAVNFENGFGFITMGNPAPVRAVRGGGE